MATDIAIKGTADIEVIKHRIYEVRGMRVKSQIATSSLDMVILRIIRNLWSKISTAK